jgi:hypothetical protein
MCRPALLLFALLAAAGCDSPTPEPTPVRATLPPTLAATAVFNPAIPQSGAAGFDMQGQNDPTAAALPRDSELPPLALGETTTTGAERVQVTAADGALLEGDLYAVTATDAAGSPTRTPAVLFLAPDRAAWLDLPLRLQSAGYTVLSLSLRPAGVGDASGDFPAALAALAATGTADPGRIAVVGAERGGLLALAGCAREPLCDAAAVFSPAAAPAVLLDALAGYGGRPLFLAAAEAEAAALGDFRASARALSGYETADTPLRGAALVQARPAIGDALIAWLRDSF